MTLPDILNPQFLGAAAVGALAIYAWYSLTTDKRVEESNERALQLHSATYNGTKKLYQAVENEMANKLINSTIISSNHEVVKLTSQVEELEQRKDNLIREIAKLEQGDYASIVQEITIIREEIGKVYNSIEKELNPVMKLLEKGQNNKAEHNFKSVEFKHKKTLNKTDKLLAKKPDFLK